MAAVVSAAQLVQAIQSTLVRPVVSHSGTTPEYDLYEVYLFGLCIQAAESIGMSVAFEDAAGTPVNTLTLRTSSSATWSQAPRFTHASLSKGGEARLEVHLGIYLRAASGVSHEGDIVVIDAGERARARALQGNPRVNREAVIIEAKFHAANIRLRTGREFLGLVAEVGGGPAIFVASSSSAQVHRLLSHRSRSGHFELIPVSNQENELKSRIATKVRDYLGSSGVAAS